MAHKEPITAGVKRRPDLLPGWRLRSQSCPVHVHKLPRVQASPEAFCHPGVGAHQLALVKRPEIKRLVPSRVLQLPPPKATVPGGYAIGRVVFACVGHAQCPPHVHNEQVLVLALPWEVYSVLRLTSKLVAATAERMFPQQTRELRAGEIRREPVKGGLDAFKQWTRIVAQLFAPQTSSWGSMERCARVEQVMLERIDEAQAVQRQYPVPLARARSPRFASDSQKGVQAGSPPHCAHGLPAYGEVGKISDQQFMDRLIGV